MILKIFDLTWIDHHLLYFAGVGAAFIFYFLIKIIIKVSKDIKKMDRKRQEKLINYMRSTSKYNKNNKPKKLSFDEED